MITLQVSLVSRSPFCYLRSAQDQSMRVRPINNNRLQDDDVYHRELLRKQAELLTRFCSCVAALNNELNRAWFVMGDHKKE